METVASETGTKGPDIDRRMGSMDAMEGAEMDYLPIPPAPKDFNKGFEEDEDY